MPVNFMAQINLRFVAKVAKKLFGYETFRDKNKTTSSVDVYFLN